jgi:hypothetical protein
MGMTTFIRGGISVIVGILGLYILEIAFPMDMLYVRFNALIPTLYLSPTWAGIAQGTLGGWVWYDRAFVICVIALFVWLGSLIFIDLDYSKQRGNY